MKIGYAVSLLTGIAIGSGVGYIVTKKLLEDKYQQIANNEIASVKARYARQKPLIVNVSKEDIEKEEATLKEVEEVIQENNYNGIIQNEVPTNIPDDVEIISPEEFINPDYDDYEKVSYILFEDGVLSTDGLTEIDPEYAGLDEVVSSIGMYEADAIHARIPSYHMDVEICTDPLDRTFEQYQMDKGIIAPPIE